MATRITTYQQAFEDVLGIPFDEKMQTFVKRMEEEGHTEKSICFVIWRTQSKLLIYKKDKRLLSILENEINKWSWKKDDPRWQEYWKRKEEAQKAKAVRQELDAISKDDLAWRNSKKCKGYVYFIQGENGGAIKIGYSLNPEKRLKELQTGYPDTLILLLMIPGDEKLEKAIHRELQASRLNGEWFRPDYYLIGRIKALKAGLDMKIKEAKARYSVAK